MINVLLYLPRPPGGNPLLREQARLDPARFHVDSYGAAASGSGGRLIRALREVPRLARLIEDRGIDIVNAHLHRSILPAVLAARRARNRPAVVATIHGLGSARTRGRRLMNRLLYRGVDRIVAVSDAVREDIILTGAGLHADKVVTIRNGLDFAPFPAGITSAEARARLPLADREGVWFGTVGRLSRGKNTASLVRAFARVHAVRSGCHLVVAGEGPEERSLRNLAARLGVEGRTAFLGYRDDIPEVLAALDVFVHASLREGFCLALLEAMAAGLPVVAARRGGVIEVLGDSDAGRPVDPEDVEAIAAAMLELLDAGSAEREAMGQRGRERALREFSAQGMVAGLERLYDGVMERRRAAMKK
jgi:glycosyltransferase involved in cell wall biosynthesis